MLSRSRQCLAVLPAALLLGALLLPGSALAHERRTIADGKYDVVVGWDVEPGYQGQKNGASIRTSQAGSNPAVPVEGVEKTLKAQIRQGATTGSFPCAPSLARRATTSPISCRRTRVTSGGPSSARSRATR